MSDPYTPDREALDFLLVDRRVEAEYRRAGDALRTSPTTELSYEADGFWTMHNGLTVISSSSAQVHAAELTPQSGPHAPPATPLVAVPRDSHPSLSFAAGALAGPLPALPHFQQPVPIPDRATYARCLWGADCPIILDDLSSGGITRHLGEYHFNDEGRPYHARNRGPCQWLYTEHGPACDKEMFYGEFGTHVSTVHLRSNAQQCPRCGRGVSRRDVLHRHAVGYCPGPGF
ncbi:hypothetical protein AcW1_001694 [Taiwanofungus camphoratus]|nr:hypothetical protein AcV5_000264 [Antrodia cinnamomea]KAI0944866.1 hypothetical protein AcV7_001552 [Antrodia cinnamomea]KAI0945479.1 hypothetical protein AcW1_001694 [Antrodia cinnamomea]